ncbi:MAG: Ppx/GppA phosphatase family protein [Desulfitobacteriaceae bacterium]|nr:Ppx/GppA phosphatase family protein [Desulfitobacteriaceae bacterium]
MKNKAAVDIGTNSIRMLIGVPTEGKVQVVNQTVEETRLGAGIAGKRLLPESMERTIQVLKKYRQTADKYSVTDACVIATSAVRDAVNRNEFCQKVKCSTGWGVRVLTGEEEAAFAFRGAVTLLPFILGMPVVIDIGGGSTEIIFSTEQGVIGSSVNIGAVRLKENPLKKQDLEELLLPPVQKLISTKEKISIIGVGGTATTAAAIYYGVVKYARENVQGKILSLNNLEKMKRELDNMSPDERKKVAGLPPKRADIISPGLQILITVLRLLRADRVVISDAGILDGVILSM